MPNRKRPFQNGEIYHITLRRIGNDLIFKDIDDYYRGIFSIYEFNNSNSVSIYRRRKERLRLKEKFKELTRSNLTQAVQGRALNLLMSEDKRERLVDCLSFVLMPNHLHLLLKQLVDGGISKFMQKLGTGFAMHFREKYREEKGGYFFQNRFHSVHIIDENQLRIVFVYIHTNPISLIEPGWKEKGMKNPKKAIEFIENYKWSSYQDLLGKKNFPSVTQRDFLSEIIGGKNDYKALVDDWACFKKKILDLNVRFDN
ncbi:MAG: transposase, partial [Patescibacteria group bacterium]